MPRLSLLATLAAALALSACATTPFTGPVEVTRFVAPDRAGLGQGPIVIYFPDEVANAQAKAAITAAVTQELLALGYTIAAQEGRGIQVAAVRTARTPIAATIDNRRGPVNVGVGGGTGSFGSGLGMGVGINLGGGASAQVETTLAVRLLRRSDKLVIWEGKASQIAKVGSPAAQPGIAAAKLAEAMFKGFPGVSGETIRVP